MWVSFNYETLFYLAHTAALVHHAEALQSVGIHERLLIWISFYFY